jgi:hypothetical protein
MVDVEEKVTITVDEDKDIEKSRINDITYDLQLIEASSSFIETDLIIGELDSIILQSNKAISIKVSFLEIPIIIYENVNFVGIDYIPLRVSPRSKENEKFNFAPQKWILNNRLKIEVKGPTDTRIKIILRSING